MKRPRLHFLAVVCVVLVAVFKAPPVHAEVDWAEVEREATAFLSEYIRIDTTNPPGNEIAAARFLAQRFGTADIEAEVFEAAPGRGSVLARLKGSGRARPIILLNHLDVVPATASEWQAPPFSGTVQDGYVHGRGAIDCKGPGTVDAMTLLLLKRLGISLQRDVIFLGTADEETGGKLGAGWMVATHFDKLGDAAFVLNEGGAIRQLDDGRLAYRVAVAEKTRCWLRLSTTGPAGHGSAPPPQTAVTRLLRALQRVQQYKPALRVTPEVQAYFAASAALETGTQRTAFQDLRSALIRPSFRKQFLQDRRYTALVHNTLTPTVLQASPKTNVIPRSASAELDCRLLPGEDPEAFVRSIKQLIDDPAVDLEVILNFPPASSPTDTLLFAALRQAASEEQALIIPSVLTGFTDSHYFREKGIVSYGFIPFVLPDGEASREHGIDERLSTANLRDGIRRLLELLQRLDSTTEDAAN